VQVSFADFIMAINLIALSEFFLDFQIMFCMFGVREGMTNSLSTNTNVKKDSICQGNVYALPILSALPHWYVLSDLLDRY
jgi:hypothetical protein